LKVANLGSGPTNSFQDNQETFTDFPIANWSPSQTSIEQSRSLFLTGESYSSTSNQDCKQTESTPPGIRIFLITPGFPVPGQTRNRPTRKVTSPKSISADHCSCIINWRLTFPYQLRSARLSVKVLVSCITPRCPKHSTIPSRNSTHNQTDS
jgi:hypothetical protein